MNYIPTSQKGAANGVAKLDASAKLPLSCIPTSVTTVTTFTGDDASALKLRFLRFGRMVLVQGYVSPATYLAAGKRLSIPLGSRVPYAQDFKAVLCGACSESFCGVLLNGNSGSSTGTMDATLVIEPKSATTSVSNIYISGCYMVSDDVLDQYL
jgi:hypothetical protein